MSEVIVEQPRLHRVCYIFTQKNMTLNSLNVNIILSKLRQIGFPYTCIIKDYHIKSFKCHLEILLQDKRHVVSNVLVFFTLKRGGKRGLLEGVMANPDLYGCK